MAFVSARADLERLLEDIGPLRIGDTLTSLRPGGVTLLQRLGHAYAGLGRTEDAANVASRIAALPPDQDLLLGVRYQRVVAEVLAQAGLVEEASDLIEEQLDGASSLTLHVLRLDPIWDPIRETPQFQAILRRND